MPRKTVEVDCDLDDFTDDEILEEVTIRGIPYSSYIDADEMVEALEKEGYFCTKEIQSTVVSNKDLIDLYYDYIGHSSEKYFDKKLNEFFRKTIGKTIL